MLVRLETVSSLLDRRQLKKSLRCRHHRYGMTVVLHNLLAHPASPLIFVDRVTRY